MNQNGSKYSKVYLAVPFVWDIDSLEFSGCRDHVVFVDEEGKKTRPFHT